MFIVFWLVFLLFMLTSLALVGIVIMQEPKQGGLGEGVPAVGDLAPPREVRGRHVGGERRYRQPSAGHR